MAKKFRIGKRHSHSDSPWDEKWHRNINGREFKFILSDGGVTVYVLKWFNSDVSDWVLYRSFSDKSS